MQHSLDGLSTYMENILFNKYTSLALGAGQGFSLPALKDDNRPNAAGAQCERKNESTLSSSNDTRRCEHRC